MKLIFLIPLSLFLIFAGCSASTGSRYEKTEKGAEKKEKEELELEIPVETEFDITPYKEEFHLTGVIDAPINTEELDLWYNYNIDTTQSLSANEIVDQIDGYRVQVIATDDLEEANQIRSELNFKLNQKAVYIVFEPPFYKVKTGDFKDVKDARDLSFKLNQMGYKESRVVTEKVNVYR